MRQDTKALQLFRKAEEFWILNMNHTVMRRIAPSLCDFLNPHTMLSDKFYSLPLPAEFFLFRTQKTSGLRCFLLKKQRR
ncbi:MAG TPA: hypothetical protein PLN48_03735, partial [Lachnospiraceae bacterium]|nr:hypothetical protein [Lachnospiraceae bacterium]